MPKLDASGGVLNLFAGLSQACPSADDVEAAVGERWPSHGACFVSGEENQKDSKKKGEDSLSPSFDICVVPHS
jgi:hypothetical protein